MSATKGDRRQQLPNPVLSFIAGAGPEDSMGGVVPVPCPTPADTAAWTSPRPTGIPCTTRVKAKPLSWSVADGA